MSDFCAILAKSDHYGSPFTINPNKKLTSCQKATSIISAIAAGILFPLVGALIVFYGLTALFKLKGLKKISGPSLTHHLSLKKTTHSEKAKSNTSLESKTASKIVSPKQEEKSASSKPNEEKTASKKISFKTEDKSGSDSKHSVDKQSKNTKKKSELVNSAPPSGSKASFSKNSASSDTVEYWMKYYPKSFEDLKKIFFEKELEKNQLLAVIENFREIQEVQEDTYEILCDLIDVGIRQMDAFKHNYDLIKSLANEKERTQAWDHMDNRSYTKTTHKYLEAYIFFESIKDENDVPIPDSSITTYVL